MWGRLRAMLEPLPAEPVIYEPDWQANSTRPPGRCRTVDGVGRLAASAEQVAYEAGRRDLALELLAMMRLSPEDLRIMMEMDDA